MDQKLMSLKIPATWAILYNSFGDEDPDVCDGTIINDEYYNEDLLAMQRLQRGDAGWFTGSNGYTLDLGWYPEANPDGHFRLVLVYGDWDNVIAEFESKDRREVQAKIECYLDLVIQGVDHQHVMRLFASKEPSARKDPSLA